MKHKTYIIHFHPIFYYPPAQNLIIFFLEKKELIKVVSTKIENQPSLHHLESYVSYIFTKKKLGGFINVIKQIYFNVATLILIIQHRPTHIIYYETLSALPAILYKKFINKKVKIICHYHELNAKDNLSRETKSLQFIRKIELKNYPIYDWISQTNELRKDIFIEDYMSFLNGNDIFVLPNYPPKNWAANKEPKIKGENGLKKFVLVGSINLEKMYLEEFCNLLETQNFDFIFDIYSFNINENTNKFIASKSYIRYKGSTSYNKIPDILKDYDIGVILYKPTSINTINCVSNKLFEYHICGLDVIFPSDMIYSKNYLTSDTYPIIKEIDFSNTENIDLGRLFNKSGLRYQIRPFTAEAEINKLYQTVYNNENIV